MIDRRKCLGHVYTYATAKLQPMITSEAGKTLIQACLAKDEPVVETVVENPTTTLNNNDVICVDDNQRKKRTHTSMDCKLFLSIDSRKLINSFVLAQSTTDASTGHRSIKRPKLKPSDDSSVSTKPKSLDSSHSHLFSSATTTAVPLAMPCFIHPDPQQHSSIPSSYTIDLNTLKNNGMNIIFTPSSATSTNTPSTTTTTSNSSETSPPSSLPLVLTLSNFSYPSS